MDELIDLIIEILYATKYSPIFNKYRNFKKKLDRAGKVDGEIAVQLQNIVFHELNKVNVRNNGTPYYFYFESIGHCYYMLFVITEDCQFYCRLKNIKVEMDCELPNKFYIIVL